MGSTRKAGADEASAVSGCPRPPAQHESLWSLVLCDIVMVQPEGDTTGEAVLALVKELSEYNLCRHYAQLGSQRLGYRTYKDQIIFVYKSDMVSVTKWCQFGSEEAGEAGDFAERPFAARFQTSSTTTLKTKGTRPQKHQRNGRKREGKKKPRRKDGDTLHACPRSPSPPVAVQEAVEVALDAGYRHVDCAYFYQNEAEIGAAFQKKFGEGKLKRDELYVVSKLWNIFHAPQDVKPAFLKSLTMLNLDYLDLYLMHSPMGFPNISGELMPQKDGLLLQSDVDYVDTWRAMEKLVDEGLVKSVGVSNFNVSQLERLLSVCRIKPAANQVELHPYLTQPELVEYCKSKGIVLIAYSPFGCPALPCPSGENSPVPLLENPTVNEIAQKHGKTSAQVLIRFHIQRGIATIPKSITPTRIVENAEVYDFHLTRKEIQMLEGLNCNTRFIKWNLLG
ncbi:1,5-anhydro-D-fructose reductase-like [Gopherus evgoodei]|uniref:1,5-anhydro-D-fructose reductase-like n=1 Tax=Gopherus evgoodei TaxID=1825980 RepID=UPI0011CFEE0E|nr:1,5-anhydro-D-fructose reductase-like [Gopherus evgoodei]